MGGSAAAPGRRRQSAPEPPDAPPVGAEREALLVVVLDDLNELIPRNPAAVILQLEQEIVDLNPAVRVQLNPDQFRLVSKGSGEELAVAAHAGCDVVDEPHVARREHRSRWAVAIL